MPDNLEETYPDGTLYELSNLQKENWLKDYLSGQFADTRHATQSINWAVSEINSLREENQKLKKELQNVEEWESITRELEIILNV